MGENMKRISTALSICAVLGAFGFSAACSSGDADPSTTPGGSSGSGGKAGSSGSSASGGSGGSMGGSSGSGGAGGSSATGGAGGAGGSAGSGAKSVCDTKTRTIPPAEAFIDNFETDTRFGGWYSFADTDAANHNKIARAAGGALSTAMAGHVSATGIKAPTAMGFGAGFGFNLVDSMGNCAGITEFDGVSFWAKGTAGADNVLTFQAVHPAMQPTTEMPPGDCLSNCFNHPKKTITLTANWQQYSIKWSELTGPVAVKGVIFGINWITPGPAYDVWIDEVTLFKGTAPTGPVGSGDGGP